MALKKTVITSSGLQAVDAYHRVEQLKVVSKDAISFCVRSYASIEKPNFNEVNYSCSYFLDGENPIKQAYEHLKTMPEFAGATDC